MLKNSSRPYRQGAITVISNIYGQLLVGERYKEENSFQFPQGGLDPGELPEQAALREAQEETGISKSQLISCGAICPSQSYDFPHHSKDGITAKFQGQHLHSFLFLWKTPSNDLLTDFLQNNNSHREFRSFKWVNTINPKAGNTGDIEVWGCSSSFLQHVWTPRKPIYESIIMSLIHWFSPSPLKNISAISTSETTNSK